MAEHRADGLQVYGVLPEIEKLYGDRYRLTFRCELPDNQEEWYHANKDNLFADFKTLSDAGFGNAPAKPDPDSTWPNQYLIRHGLEYLQGKDGGPIVRFDYVTLTNTFVQEAADKVDYELNGLRRVTRTLIALDGATYNKTVGTSTITHDEHGYGSVSLELASAVEDEKPANEDGYVRIVETWLEPGILKQTTDTRKGGTIKIRSETVFGSQAFTFAADGFNEIANQTTEFEGYQTKTRVWAKGDITDGDIAAGVISKETIENYKDTLTTGQTIYVTESVNSTPPGYASRLISKREVQNDGYVSYVYTEVTEGDQETVTVTERGLPFCNELISSGYGTLADPTGILVSNSTAMDARGSILSNKRTLNFTPGVIATWKQILEVRVAGTVEAKTFTTPEVSLQQAGFQAPSFDGQTEGTYDAGNGVTLYLTDLSDLIVIQSGTIAYAEVKPPSTKKVRADVAYRVTSTPAPSTTTLAYDFSSVSVGATFFKQRIYWTSGVARATPSVSSQSYPGHYILNTSAITGEVSDSLIFGKTITDVRLAGPITAPTTNGILSYTCRPLFTATDGTIYYEEIEVTV